MKNNLLYPIIIAMACLMGGCSTTNEAPSESASQVIRNLNQIDDIYLAGQPQPEYFAQAEKQGLATVICLRDESEITGFDEGKIVDERGMTYVNIPFQGPEELTDSVFDEVRQQLVSADRPILIHCGSANRVAAVWIPFRVLDEGLAWEEALAEAKSIGLRTPAYEERAKAYIEKVKGGL